MRKRGIIKTCLASLIGLYSHGCGLVADSQRGGLEEAIDEILDSPDNSYIPYEPEFPDSPSANQDGPYPVNVVYYNNAILWENLIGPTEEENDNYNGAAIGKGGSFLDSGIIFEWGHEINKVYLSFYDKPCPEDFAIYPFELIDVAKNRINMQSDWPERLPSIDAPLLPINDGNINIESNYPSTDYKVTFSPSKYVGIFNYSDLMVVYVIKDSGFNYGANAYCAVGGVDFGSPDDSDDNPDPIDDESPGVGDENPGLEKYLDSGPANILGPPDGKYEYVGFGDTIYGKFIDNVPLNGYGADIIVYTEKVSVNKSYSIIISTGSDFIDRTGILYEGLKNIEIDISDLSGDFSKIEIALLADPYNENGPLGFDAIESVYNE